MLKIVNVPDNILTNPTKPVDKIDEKIKKLIKEMEETLIAQDDPPGVGLAANQVDFNLSIFIIKPSKKAKIKVFINPKIIKTVFNKDSLSKRASLKKKKKPVKLEGCLSIPKIWGPVKRAEKVLLQYQNLTGAVVQKWFTGFEAVIIQHEMDHLNGIIFTQRALEQGEKLYKEVNKELKPIEI